MDAVKAVKYNDGEKDLFAIVVDDLGGSLVNLMVVDPYAGSVTFQTNVPKRDKKDYDAAGGGRTWYV